MHAKVMESEDCTTKDTAVQSGGYMQELYG
eukprot:SAG31_NODE_21700_length_543_cov_0.700450_1_plen_30_part_10